MSGVCTRCAGGGGGGPSSLLTFFIRWKLFDTTPTKRLSMKKLRTTIAATKKRDIPTALFFTGCASMRVPSIAACMVVIHPSVVASSNRVISADGTLSKLMVVVVVVVVVVVLVQPSYVVAGAKASRLPP